MNKPLKILGIETSCDETALALVEIAPDPLGPHNILKELVYSQITEHAAYGGVVPEIAGRSHLEKLPILYHSLLNSLESQSLKEEFGHGTGVPFLGTPGPHLHPKSPQHGTLMPTQGHIKTTPCPPPFNAPMGPAQNEGVAPANFICATVGPGLVGALLMGALYGKSLALANGIPFHAVNHLEGHILSPLLADDLREKLRALHQPQVFPYLLLLISGGHCQILRVDGIGTYTLLGASRDDAAGECLDKTARLLGLARPNGAELEKVAAPHDPFAIPLPSTHLPGLDFSFSGLKTAVAQRVTQARMPVKAAHTATQPLRDAKVEQNKTDSAKTADRMLDATFVGQVAAAVQRQVAVQLAQKVEHALQLTGLKLVCVAGGVAANQTIRQALETVVTRQHGQLVAAPLKYCGDNAVMIALAAGLRYHSGCPLLPTTVRPRWPVANPPLPTTAHPDV